MFPMYMYHHHTIGVKFFRDSCFLCTTTTLFHDSLFLKAIIFLRGFCIILSSDGRPNSTGYNYAKLMFEGIRYTAFIGIRIWTFIGYKKNKTWYNVEPFPDHFLGRLGLGLCLCCNWNFCVFKNWYIYTFIKIRLWYNVYVNEQFPDPFLGLGQFFSHSAYDRVLQLKILFCVCI